MAEQDGGGTDRGTEAEKDPLMEAIQRSPEILFPILLHLDGKIELWRIKRDSPQSDRDEILRAQGAIGALQSVRLSLFNETFGGSDTEMIEAGCS